MPVSQGHAAMKPCRVSEYPLRDPPLRSPIGFAAARSAHRTLGICLGSFTPPTGDIDAAVVRIGYDTMIAVMLFDAQISYGEISFAPNYRW